MRVFRSQCADVDLSQFQKNVVCVCGLGAKHSCGACKSTLYCSKNHQVEHWKTHKKKCSEMKVDGLFKYLFKESELVHDEEENYESQELSDSMNSLALVQTQFKESISVDLGTWTEEEYENSSCKVDKAFLKFQKRISKHPDQVLRYARGYDPLWVSEVRKILSSNEVPNCQLCGSERMFEFQLLPQLLLHLDIDYHEPNSIDYGTICVYSCASNCNFSGYAEEFLYRQDFSSEGLRLE